MVHSIRPKDPTTGKIAIQADPRAGGVRSKAASPEAFWMNYYRTRFEKPNQLRFTVATLNAEKKFRDVRAALIAYLTYYASKDGKVWMAEPWMYEALALATKMTQPGKEGDVKTALGYAADLAVRSRNPNYLVSVADQMLLMGELERAGPLLDQAAELVPHRPEPVIMSINLAQRARDPKRMADSVDRLLSLGWPGDPGTDEGVRRDARKQVETLAKALREDGKTAEADELLKKLTDSEARDLVVRLTWLGDADLDLVVEDPLGTKTSVRNPRTVAGGSIVQNGYGSHPEEVFVCPRGFDGEYTVRVDTIWNNDEKPALKATVEVITHEGTPREHKETHTVTLGKSAGPVKVTLQGGRRKKALPYVSPTAVTEQLMTENPASPKKKATAPGTAKAAGRAPAPVPAPAPAAPTATARPTGPGVR
jgi:hypothetical protein